MDVQLNIKSQIINENVINLLSNNQNFDKIYSLEIKNF